jgi:predicted nucleic acid-binding protein
MLLDSNIIIIASKLVDVKLISYLRTNEKDLHTSIIAQIEVLGYHQLKQVEKTFLENFFKSITVIPLDTAVAAKAIELRQRKPISLADALVAATALIYDLTLLTENIKDYTGIKDLKLVSIKDVLGQG